MFVFEHVYRRTNLFTRAILDDAMSQNELTTIGPTEWNDKDSALVVGQAQTNFFSQHFVSIFRNRKKIFVLMETNTNLDSLKFDLKSCHFVCF